MIEAASNMKQVFTPAFPCPNSSVTLDPGSVSVIRNCHFRGRCE